MSGGSLDYVYSRVSEAAVTIRGWQGSTPLHLAFANHLDLVATALHDLEWVFSDDKKEGDEIPALRALIPPAEELAEACEVAQSALNDLLQTMRNVGAAMEINGDQVAQAIGEFSQSRFGVFNAHGDFEEMFDGDVSVYSPRWVGGSKDVALLRAFVRRLQAIQQESAR